MKKELLTRSECSVLRGIAIIGIFLHNYCHWLNPIVKENEYQYFQHNVDWFTQVMVHSDGKILMHLLSFFGHYGVPIFLFLSAYGLVCKYESTAYLEKHHDSIFQFIRYHFMKLFKMMIVGFVAFLMVDRLTPGPWNYSVIDVVAQLGLVNNFLVNPDRHIWPGPYWFFGLMLQLYIIYRLLLYRRSWKWTVGAMVVCWLAQIFCDPEGETLNYIRYSSIGGVLPFGLGLLYAHFGKQLSTQQNAIMVVVSAILIVAGSYSYQTWYFVPVFVCTFSVGMVKMLTALASHFSIFSFLFNRLNWVGSISAALFVSHPITRKIFIVISRNGDMYTGLLIYAIVSLCLAWVFHLLMEKLPK
ncbi:acyltransferase family protein [Segatella bryantii]|jgi:peptidoglycan/LPS O-acetylase OafA/YrhL|uniref:acyltransferase family protein n=1 Tax=Segatella bryantii TaxID=77095 RepID=UPI00242E4E11|nr:acyltransferase family protein [Segatella bryantii]